MSDEIKDTEKVVEKISSILSPDNISKYVLGTKKNGHPRAIYDIIKDYTIEKKKKKNKKQDSAYSLYFKKHKKKKNKKHWHI